MQAVNVPIIHFDNFLCVSISSNIQDPPYISGANSRSISWSRCTTIFVLQSFSVTCWHISSVCRKSRSEEHTSELQSRFDLVCRLLLEKKKQNKLDSDPIRHRNGVG